MSARVLRPNPELAQPASRPLSQRLMRTVLSPLLQWQGRRLSQNIRDLSLHEADNPTWGRAGSGMNRVRLLIVGDSIVTGTGLPDCNEHLAPQLAQQLADLLTEVTCTKSAVSWQLVAHPEMSAHEALPLLAATRLQPADVLVTVLGFQDALMSTAPTRWLQDLDTLRSHARHRAKVRFTVHCTPPRLTKLTALPQPLRWAMDSSAHELDMALHRHVRNADRRSRYVLPFDGSRDDSQHWAVSDGLHPNAETVRRWAQGLAEHIEFDLAQAQLRRATLPTGFQVSGFTGFDRPDLVSHDHDPDLDLRQS